MKRVVVPAVFVLAVVLGAVVSVDVFKPQVWGYPRVCDASVPGWMLEAQDHDGRGCPMVLPSDMAPADADWSIYCTMWCERTWPPGED
jgi:hypothetical protein